MKSGKFVKCYNCGKLIYQFPSRLKKVKKYFCSLNCRAIASRIYQKESSHHLYKRVKKICQFCGKEFIVANYRKDIAKFCSYRCKSKSFTGKKSNNWKGGITLINHLLRTSDKMKLWRLSVFERDKFTCKKCGDKGVYLHAHHIKSFAEYPELRFSINNGITLCRKCHYQLHGRLRKGKHHSPKTEFKKGHKINLGKKHLKRNQNSFFERK